MSERPTRCGRVMSWQVHGPRFEAVHQTGTTRIEAMDRDILRVRFAPDGRFKGAPSWDMLTGAAAPGGSLLDCAERDGTIAIDAGTWGARIDRRSGAVGFIAGSGTEFARDLEGPAWHPARADALGIAGDETDALPAGAAATAVELSKHLSSREHYTGLGQRTGRLNRRHRRLSNWTTDILPPAHSRAHDNLYQAHPFLLAVRPELAWGLFLHSGGYSHFDLGATEEDVLRILTLGGELDYFLLTGPAPAQVVEQLTRLTGRPPVPPLWALGFHQSRWSYPDSAQAGSVVASFRDRGIPLDALHLDIDYMRGYRDFTWDPDRFPDPPALTEALHARGVHTVCILDPGVKYDLSPDYPVAREGLARDVFIRRPDGEPFAGYCWPGPCLFPDFTRADVRRWWGDQHTPLVEAGVDGIWVDMNEPAIFDRPVGAPGLRLGPVPLASPQGDPDEATSHAETHNFYGHLMARATREGLERLRPRRRPWVLTRSAFTGTQRYAVSWMGDNSSRWEDLAQSVPQLAGMGLSGMVHVGVDIGGFYENAHPELYARWMELGTFYPFMRCHTATGTRPQEPWQFGPEVEAVSRRAIELRYRLLPYWYTLAHLAHRTGAPIWRPLVYEFPRLPALYNVEDQAMIGPHLMIAPVCEPGTVERLVRLPEGLWYDFHGGGAVEGGSHIVSAPLGRIPVFVRAGAVLTLGNLRQSTSQPLTELTVAVYPGAPGEWTLIEDDGDSPDYLQGELAETTYRVRRDQRTTTVTVEHRTGRYRPAPRRLVLRVHLGGPPERVSLDGKPFHDWQWDPEQQAVLVSRADDGAAHIVEITEAA